MTDLQDRTLHYYRQQQYQPGWFDLLSVMINGMLRNAGERESHAFLQQMGDTLAARYPLGAANTVADLESQINAVLAQFNWGFVDVQPRESSMVISHMALPPGDGQIEARQWRQALGAVLLGLYARWLHDQGGNQAVPLVCEETDSEATLNFRYQR
ncbi:cellulose biosynthesis protein BcsD [Erwinia billingiae]|uniref:cellulose biosynthesis protein BcsD n=1 Tax=Erwinia billingiae TaxID=182337 RepID=UPI0022485815|nr:cellulose biosynthesis protein BcsD [Erwinia billingiae]MCX0498537.1 cellulose synthase [Erwinia billingiae]